MDRLDELSKLLAVSVSRRESLRSIGAVLAGTVFGSLGLGTAWAARPDRCTAFCRWCPTRKKRNQCLAACRACNGNTSRLCGSCGAYVCCPTGAACCNGTCTDVNSDPANCGACGNTCAAGLVCQNSSCQPCAAGLTACSGVCVYLPEDPQNCGSCGNVCPLGTSCLGGACQPNDSGGCSGYGAGICSGVCVNLLSDAGNCGSCGHECQSDELCSFGVCTGSCSGCQ